MLTQLPNGDWIELASIIQVTAVEMTPGEWATIGQGPGGHWITLAPRPENKLLTRTEAERLRDVWAGDVNKAKTDAIKAEATERLAVLQQWRSDRRTKERASEASTWQTPEIHTYRLNIETRESTLVDVNDQTEDDVSPPNCPTCQVPLRSVANRSDGMHFGGCEKCNSTYFFKGSMFYSRDPATAEFTPVDPQPSPAAYHKSRNQPPSDHDPIYHCPRCGHEAPRSQWSVLGIELSVLPDGAGTRRCAACWNSGHSVIPHEGPSPGTVTTERTAGGILLPSEQLPFYSPYLRDKITVEPGNEASIDIRLEPTGLGFGEVLPPKVTTVAETKADEEDGKTWRDRKPLA